MVTRQKYTRFATLANWSAIQAASAVVGLVSKRQNTVYNILFSRFLPEQQSKSAILR